MNQLVVPNLSVVGYPSYCLAYAGAVFGLSSENTPDAWEGWLATQFKHVDALPNLVVPVWFSWTGTIGGITQNWGHVAVSTPGGIYTNPLTGSGHKVFPTVPDLEAAYGVKYVGWSEDISNLRVVEEDEMSTIGDVEARILIKHIYGYTNELDIEGAIPALVGGESNTIIRMMDSTPTAAAYQAQIKAWANQTPASFKNVGTINGENVYEQS